MIKYIRILICSYYWTKSITFSNQKKFDEAIFYLEKISSKGFCFDEVYYTHKGFLKAVSGNKEAAIECFGKSIEYSNSQKSSLNDDEKIYLINYATDVLSFLNVYDEPFRLSNKYDRENVSKYLLKQFPFQ